MIRLTDDIKEKKSYDILGVIAVSKVWHRNFVSKMSKRVKA